MVGFYEMKRLISNGDYFAEPLLLSLCGFNIASDLKSDTCSVLPEQVFIASKIPCPNKEKQRTIQTFFKNVHKKTPTRLLDAVKKILNDEELSFDEAQNCMEDLMTGIFTPLEIGLFLGALETRQSTVSELTAFAMTMRKHAKRVRPRVKDMMCDTCGTGGDARKTFNVSTATVFILAASGIPVAKHGNRSFSSLCGSADLLENLGANINKTPEQVEASIETTGIGFMFAPLFHPAMHHVMSARKEIKKRTIFNRLGPLVNPAEPEMQLLGVYEPKLTATFARVLKNLGVKRAMVVHGYDEKNEPGLDEVSISGKTVVSSLTEDGRIHELTIDPANMFLNTFPCEDLQGNTAVKNASLLRSIMVGEAPSGLIQFTLINAAVALWMAGKAKDIEEGIKLSREIIATGKAEKKMNEFIEFSTRD